MHVLDAFDPACACPVDPFVILASQTLTPGQIVVHLYEVVIPQHRFLRLKSLEHVEHSFLKPLFVLRDIARGVDLRERHTEFVFEAPEACKEDGAREEVVLAVWTLRESLARWNAAIAVAADGVTYLDHDR